MHVQLDKDATLSNGGQPLLASGNIKDVALWDIAIATNGKGFNDGIVQSCTFILSALGTDLDISLLQDSFW
jgi:hypothetical protein